MEYRNEFRQHFMFVAEKGLQVIGIVPKAFHDYVAFIDYVSQGYLRSRPA